jgi:copper homeostasis protein CutC
VNKIINNKKKKQKQLNDLINKLDEIQIMSQSKIDQGMLNKFINDLEAEESKKKVSSEIKQDHKGIVETGSQSPAPSSQKDVSASLQSMLCLCVGNDCYFSS